MAPQPRDSARDPARDSQRDSQRDPAREPSSDAELVDAANRGDAAAFEALYDRYRDWVVALAWRLTGDRDLALDAMQETFVYLLRQFPGFVLGAKMKTFLYPVVRHNAVALARKGRRAVPAFAPALFAEAGPDGGDVDALREAVARLPAAQREVILLRFADGLSLGEIAAAVERPLGTVKTRLHHALAALREDDRLRNFFSD